MEQRTAYEKVRIAREKNRPKITDYIDGLFSDFLEIKGDRLGGEDAGILCGIGLFHEIPVTVIGHRKGKNTEENIRCNFGMGSPEGYRKAMRAMLQAEKFGRPVVTFIDTPGAYPGVEAENHGQSAALAESIALMSRLKVPVISIVTGEGSSGGALALAVADQVWMLEHAVYAVLSPEGFASILWKDAGRVEEACRVMRLTAQDLWEAGVIDRIISEGSIAESEEEAQKDAVKLYHRLDTALLQELNNLLKMSVKKRLQLRYEKYRRIGTVTADEKSN